jgi:DNA repair exonuclease SbcCD ATPase subunit
MAAAKKEETALVALPTQSVLDVFKQAEGIQPYLDQIKDAVNGRVYDMEVKKDRDDMRSLAARIASSRVYIDGVGKELTAEYKKLPAMIDATRKYARETLEALQTEFRAPLTDFEEAEKALEQAITDTIDAIGALTLNTAECDSDELQARLERAEAFVIPKEWAKKQQMAAATAKDLAIEVLPALIAKRTQEEVDARELAERRAADARRELERQARDKADREARDKIEAAERQAREAQENAQRQIDEANRRAEQAEQRAQEQLQQQQRQQEEAKAQQQADTEAQAEAERRSQDQQHRAKINREIAAPLMQHGFTQ